MSYIPPLDDISDEVTTPLMGFASETQCLLGVAASLAKGGVWSEEPDSENPTEPEDLAWQANAMLFSRMLDNFNAYLVEIVMLTFEHYPSALGSRKIALKAVFTAANLEDLQRNAIEREVNSLSYASLSDLAQSLKSNLGVEIFPSKLMLSRVSYLQALRNLIVHNRGFMNSFSKGKISSKRFNIGQRIVLPNLVRTIFYLFHCVKIIENQFTSKFDFLDQHLMVRKDA